MSLHIEAIQPFRPEEGDDVFPVGGHRAISVCRLGMALLLGHAFVSRFIPKNFPRLLVQAEDFPLLNIIVLCRPRIAIKAHFQWGSPAFINCASDK